MRYYFLLVIFFVSCKDISKDKSQECLSKNQVSAFFYSAINDYQINNPIPDSMFNANKGQSFNELSTKYIYEVKVFNDFDSTVAITLNPSGIVRGNKQRTYGIYWDECLKPTCFFVDNQIEPYFLYIKKEAGINQFYDNNMDAVDIIYVTYVYTRKDGKLVLKEKVKGNAGQ